MNFQKYLKPLVHGPNRWFFTGIKKNHQKESFFLHVQKKISDHWNFTDRSKNFFDDLKLHLIYNGWDPGVL